MDATPQTLPPSYAESQRLARAQEGVPSIEEKGEQVYVSLKAQGLSPEQIKAIAMYVIGKLPHVKPFISESVKHSAFDALTAHLKDRFGEDEFERMASSPNSTVGDLDFDNILDVREIFQDDRELVYIARAFMEPRIVDLYESRGDFNWGEQVFAVIHANHCNMTVRNFLARINPDYPDLSSMTLSDKA